MPFSSEQVSYAGAHSLDLYLRNTPVDQVNTDRPLLKELMKGKKEYGGGLQYVVETLRYQNDSNFQSYFGGQQVTYNRKRTLKQAKYEWGSFHDGFGLDEDELAQNGIAVVDDGKPTPTDAEKIQLASLLDENNETLKLGFEENFDLMLHRDGTQSATDIAGLDALVSLTPSSGTVGTQAASNAWWQNYADLSINTPTISLSDNMEVAWRACIKFGGSAPNFILAGDDFIDAYRDDAKNDNGTGIVRNVNVGGSGGNMSGTTLDNSIGTGIKTGLYFKGVEIMWDPVFDALDTADAPTQAWSKRCYFLNTRHLKMRPIKGHWMQRRRPPRVYDRYVHYWALTSKCALTTNKRNAHAVLTIA